MRWREWRKTWMWLAMSACATASMTKSGNPKVSIFDAPPLAGARYVARVAGGRDRQPELRLALEHGRYVCAPLVEALDAIPYSNPDAQAQRFAEEEQTCPREIGTRLTQNTGTLFIVDATGPHWLSTDEALAALGRVDTRAKALLAAYLYGYDLTWFDGDHSYGAPEDGHVRKVGGGFEVVVGREVFQRLSCVSGTSEVTHSYYCLVLFVDVRGRISEREKVATQSHVSYERCYGY